MIDGAGHTYGPAGWHRRLEGEPLRSNQKRITVVVADDHPLFREALATTVRRHSQLELVGEAEAGRQALDLIKEQRPDVAVLDLLMPDLDGRQVVESMTRSGLATRALIVSGDLNPENAYELIEAGAAGLISKTEGAERLGDAVVAVARGDTVLPPDLHAGLMDQIRGHADSRHIQLSPRELEMLVDLAKGLSAPEIGRQRHLSSSTVRSYLHQLYEKLGVSDRAAAVAEGMRRGLID
jgi:two-component system nitrate/nitrite response regulator NarL